MWGLLLEMFCARVIKNDAFFTICTKLLVTMVFTFTFLEVIVVSDWEKNISGLVDLHIPVYSTPSLRSGM